MVVAPALAASPLDPAADSLANFRWDPEVPMGETWGLSFNVYNSTNEGVPNQGCDLAIYEWRDNASYVLSTYSILPACQLQWQGASNASLLSPDCYHQSAWDGGVYFTIPVTRDAGYHAAAPNAQTNGSYGTYRWAVHCGNKPALAHEGNFTVMPEGEPTFLMDWTVFAVNYRVYVAYALAAIVVLAILFYWIKQVMFG